MRNTNLPSAVQPPQATPRNGAPMPLEPAHIPPAPAPSPTPDPSSIPPLPSGTIAPDAQPSTPSPQPPAPNRALLEAEAIPLMDLVYAVARRMVGHDAKAEDLVQETYLRAFRSSAQYQPGTNCKAWLLTILRSVYIDSARHTQARGGSHEQLPHDLSSKEETVELTLNPAHFMSVLDVMVDDDIRDAMLGLPDLYREAFIMVVIAELPYKEAASVLSVQEGTVKSRVFRACQMLKTRLWKYAIDKRIKTKP